MQQEILLFEIDDDDSPLVHGHLSFFCILLHKLLQKRDHTELRESVVLHSLTLPSNAEKMETVRYTGYHADPRKASRAVKERIPSPQRYQSPTPRDHKPINRHEVKQSIANAPLLTPKSSRKYQKQFVEKKSKNGDELVKHMSNLPRYLRRVERGENIQEKVLNIGVLDWGRLEKWKDNQKHSSGGHSLQSQSHSHASSMFSTVGSSSLSSGSDSGIRTRRKQSPSTHRHLVTPFKGRDKEMRPPRGNAAPQQDLRTYPKNDSVEQQGENYLEIKFDKAEEKDSDPKLSSKKGTSSSNSTNEASYNPKSEVKAQAGAPPTRTVQFQVLALPDQHCPGRDRDRNIVLLPKTSSKKSYSGVSQQPETILSSDRHAEANLKSFSDGFCIANEVHFPGLYSDIPHSCPELDTGKCSETKLPTSLDSPGIEVRSDVYVSTMHSKDKQAEDKTPSMKSTTRIVVKPLNGTDLKVVEPPPIKGRSQSHSCRSICDVNKIRSSSSKECSSLPQLSSTEVTPNSRSSLDRPSRDKATENGKARSSPLRRLLDPLLKSNSVSHHNAAQSLQDESTPVRKVCRSLDASLDSSVQPAKRFLSFSTIRPSDIGGPDQDDQQVPPMVQVLLRVSVKNGLPWFTFAVENSSDILAATMRKVSASGKYDCSWIYTFYSFHKTKKKSGGWMSQGNKGKSHDYVPDIVGQMKVSGSQFSKLSRYDEDHTMVREFVLFGVEPRQADQEALDTQPINELAAIVFKVPTEFSVEKKFCYNSVDSLKGGISVGSEKNNIVVILPRGVHGLPVTGTPSPLINRWRTGASCDCGGWDVGCQLRVFSNKDECSKDLFSSKVGCSQEQIDLFIQGGGAQESFPFFNILSYNNGVHSIDFDASVSALQAFSISVAFLHSKNLATVRNLFEEINFQEPSIKETQSKSSYCN